MRVVLFILFVVLFSFNDSNALEWWKRSIIYEVYPMSFKDTDNDGVGDIQGLRIIIDLVLNHSSEEHPWFKDSRTSRNSTYADYYVWHSGRWNETSQKYDVPNNWISTIYGSSWTWCEERQQYYYHAFLPEQPDLNYRNPKVIEEMADILRFWIRLGVDGFRIDAPIFCYEDVLFRDNPLNPAFDPKTESEGHKKLNSIYTRDLPENYELMSYLSSVVKEEGDKLGKEIFMSTEGYSRREHTMLWYTTGISFPLNFNFMGLSKYITSSWDLRNYISKWLEGMPVGAWPNWIMSTHDRSRISSRLGGQMYSKLANTLHLLLPGTPIVYYGDELGMVDYKMPREQWVDPRGFRDIHHGEKRCRDFNRTPMQWNNSPYAGFTNQTAEKTWLPVHPNYDQINVDMQLEDRNSVLNHFIGLTKLRQFPQFSSPTSGFEFVDLHNKHIFAFKRSLPGYPSYFVILNHGHRMERLNLAQNITNLYISDSSYIMPSETLTKLPMRHEHVDLVMNPGSVLIFEAIELASQCFVYC